jgi:DNA-binding NarL/FixJ family response regulator
MVSKKRVVIVDDHMCLREMLAILLTRDGEYEIAGMAATGLEALEVCRQHRPDVVVLDVILPLLCGTEVLRRLRNEQNRARVLMYSGTLSQVQIIEALRCQPHGFIEKSDSLQTLRDALRTVAAGGKYFSAYVSALWEDVHSHCSLTLTDRERQILQMIAESCSSKQIAAMLGLAVKTVENHRAHIMDKLHLHDIAALTRYAVQQGMVR